MAASEPICKTCLGKATSECIDCGTPYCSIGCMQCDEKHELTCQQQSFTDVIVMTENMSVGIGFDPLDVKRLKLEGEVMTNITSKEKDWPILGVVDYFSNEVGFDTPLFTFISRIVSTGLFVYSVFLKEFKHTKFASTTTRRFSGSGSSSLPSMASVEYIEGAPRLIMVRTSPKYSAETFINDHKDAITHLMHIVDGEPVYLTYIEQLYTNQRPNINSIEDTKDIESNSIIYAAHEKMRDIVFKPISQTKRQQWYQSTKQSRIDLFNKNSSITTTATTLTTKKDKKKSDVAKQENLDRIRLHSR